MPILEKNKILKNSELIKKIVCDFGIEKKECQAVVNYDTVYFFSTFEAAFAFDYIIFAGSFVEKEGLDLKIKTKLRVIALKFKLEKDINA